MWQGACILINSNRSNIIATENHIIPYFKNENKYNLFNCKYNLEILECCLMKQHSTLYFTVLMTCFIQFTQKSMRVNVKQYSISVKLSVEGVGIKIYPTVVSEQNMYLLDNSSHLLRVYHVPGADINHLRV